MDKRIYTDITDYIIQQPEAVRERLQQIRETIAAAAPEAEEAISYSLPTFKLHGVLVHFGAFKNHIGFYAAPSGNEAFKKELAKYPVGKGSINFPLDQPLPLDLIAEMVAFRVAENIEKAAEKKQSKKR
jgi:uncharacterized protein YdhG (YjbR/CyaY superfamily)